MAYGRIYEIDWSRLGRQLLVRLRNGKLMLLVYGIMAAFNSLYNIFKRHRIDTAYRIRITPQVCFLERLLNDRYDPLQRRIRIVNPREFTPVVFFQREELKPVVFNQKGNGAAVVFPQKEEVALFLADFFVEIPFAVPFDQNELVSLLEIYALAGKHFLIKIV